MHAPHTPPPLLKRLARTGALAVCTLTSTSATAFNSGALDRGLPVLGVTVLAVGVSLLAALATSGWMLWRRSQDTLPPHAGRTLAIVWVLPLALALLGTGVLAIVTS